MVTKKMITDEQGNLDVDKLVLLLRELERRDVLIDSALTDVKNKQ